MLSVVKSFLKLFKINIMQNFNYLFTPLVLSYRQGNETGMRFNLEKALKRSESQDFPSDLKTRLYVEAVRIRRALEQTDTAVSLCDAAIANIQPSPDSLEYLAELKRLRVLLYLDQGENDQATSLLGEIDGLEVKRQDGSVMISRSASDIKIETYLLGVETRLANGDLSSARENFSRAAEKLEYIKTAFRKSRPSPLEKRVFAQYSSDLEFSTQVFSAVLQIAADDIRGYELLHQLKSEILEYNQQALRSNGRVIPNITLVSKIRCLLGEWTPNEPTSPTSLNYEESVRWFSFGNFRENDLKNFRETDVAESDNSGNLVGTEISTLENSNEMSLQETPSDDLLGRAIGALETIADSLGGIQRIVPHLAAGSSNFDEENPAYRFGGHVNTFDLDSLIFNIAQHHITGYIKFSWKPADYESVIAIGHLDAKVATGKAFLFAQNGHIVDAGFGEMMSSDSAEEARNNFKTLVRICFGVGLDGVKNEIFSKAYQVEGITSREAFLLIEQNDIPKFLTEIENDLNLSFDTDDTDEPNVPNLFEDEEDEEVEDDLLLELGEL